MAKFIINIPELHYSEREVEAESLEEAFRVAADGDGDEVACRFERSLEPDEYTWDGRPADSDLPNVKWNGDDPAASK